MSPQALHASPPPAAAQSRPTRNRDLSRGSHSAEEGRAWNHLYNEVLRGNASVAAQLVKLAKADPRLQDNHLGLCTLAATLVAKAEDEKKERELRKRKLRAALFLLPSLVLRVPFLLRMLRDGLFWILDLLTPGANLEPARKRTPALRNDPSFSDDVRSFEGNQTNASGRSAKTA